MADCHKLALIISTAANSLVAAAGFLNQAPALYEMQDQIVDMQHTLTRTETTYHANQLSRRIDIAKANFLAVSRTSVGPQEVANQLERVVELLREMPDWTKEVSS